MRNDLIGSLDEKIAGSVRPRSQSEEPSSLCFECTKNLALSLAGYSHLYLIPKEVLN